MAKYIAILFLIGIVSGCAYIDQNLKVEPMLQVYSSNIGRGKKIGLRVVDERDEQLIGKRMDGYGFNAAKITTDQDLVEILKMMLSEGLNKKGFEPVSENQSPSLMKAELRLLAYDASRGLWTGGNIGKAAVKVIASEGTGRTYEKTYRGQREIRTWFIGSQETNAKVVNGALEDVVANLFKDDALLQFLATDNRTQDIQSIIITDERETAKLSSSVANYSEYHRLLYKNVSSAVVKPADSGSGIVNAAFTLLNDGTLEDIKILEGSSEDVALRDAVIKAIKDSSPFPEFPADIKEETRKTFTITIEFRYR